MARSATPASDNLPTGIRRTSTGFQAYVWVKDPTKPKGGYQASRRWKFGDSPTLAAMKEWRLRAKLGLVEEHSAILATFADDASDYTRRDKVQRMPTRAQREQHIDEWVAVFGNCDRRTIQPHDIQRVLDGMRRRMSAGSVNKRRTALMDLWTTLDGRHQANPVKATTEYEEPKTLPRAPAMRDVLRLIEAMPAKTPYGRKCRARIRLIAWTGWPHTIIKQLDPTDIDDKGKRAYVQGRSKGKGTTARWIPLLPQAVDAIKEFKRADAWGTFSNSSLHKRFSKARTALEMPHVRPYDFRHFFGTLIATITRDERAVQELMLLRTPAMARRYTEAATDPRTQRAVADVARAVPGLLKAAGRIGRVSRVSVGPAVRQQAKRRKKTGRKPRKR